LGTKAMLSSLAVCLWKIWLKKET